MDALPTGLSILGIEWVWGEGVGDRERERQRETDRQTEGKRDRGSGGGKEGKRKYVEISSLFGFFYICIKGERVGERETERPRRRRRRKKGGMSK